MGQPAVQESMHRAGRLRLPPSFNAGEQRRHSRVKVNIIGRYMLSDRNEFPCQVVNMSPGGAAIMAKVCGKVGERVIAYLEDIGRIEGVIVRHFEGGFAMTVETTLHRRDKLAAKLTWLANKHELNLPEDRRFERVSPKTSVSQIVMSDGRSYECRVIDVSLSGAALGTSVRPAIGSFLMVGSMRGRVVRHLEEGIAIEFAALSSIDEVEEYLRRR